MKIRFYLVMEFRLYYRGELKSNAKPDEKQRLRRYFHPQLRALWEQPPLKDFCELLDPNNELSVIKSQQGFNFAPLVCQSISLVAELNILMLRPGPPGAIVTQGGDIDNRLKTLLDALKAPSEPTALPPNEIPQQDEDPFFCLLEDDSLITRLDVTADCLLEPTQSPTEVVLVIHVRTKQLKVFVGTLGLA